jgi:hypothetical protein
MDKGQIITKMEQALAEVNQVKQQLQRNVAEVRIVNLLILYILDKFIQSDQWKNKICKFYQSLRKKYNSQHTSLYVKIWLK